MGIGDSVSKVLNYLSDLGDSEEVEVDADTEAEEESVGVDNTPISRTERVDKSPTESSTIDQTELQYLHSLFIEVSKCDDTKLALEKKIDELKAAIDKAHLLIEHVGEKRDRAQIAFSSFLSYLFGKYDAVEGVHVLDPETGKFQPKDVKNE